MDDETPDMEAVSAEMREIMRAWIADPENVVLKERYVRLQTAFQRAFLAHKNSQIEPGGGPEAVHQAY